MGMKPRAAKPREPELPRCAYCRVEIEPAELNQCFGCDEDYCEEHALGHPRCPYTDELMGGLS